MDNEPKITYYMAEFRKAYNRIKVNKRTFDDRAQMDEMIKSEMNAENGPDIIIFPEDTGAV